MAFLKLKISTNNFDTLTPEEIGKLFPIEIVPHNPKWKELYKEEKELINQFLDKSLVANIEHIGSTSVEGLAAKPIVDILLEVSMLNDDIKLLLISKLGIIGYGNMFNSEQENKMEFGKGYTSSGFIGQPFHLHIREKGKLFQDEIYFRNYLKKNKTVCKEYENLKLLLSKRYKFNREDYTNAKSEFIKKHTEYAKEQVKNKRLSNDSHL